MYLVKSAPGQGPVPEAVVHAVHGLKEVILSLPLFEKVKLAPVFLKKGNAHSQEPDRFGVLDRFVNLQGIAKDLVAAVDALRKGLLF